MFERVTDGQLRAVLRQRRERHHRVPQRVGAVARQGEQGLERLRRALYQVVGGVPVELELTIRVGAAGLGDELTGALQAAPVHLRPDQLEFREWTDLEDV